ncbi:MAG: DinB family protein [Spirochaetales bacterium]|nr:DinB family protein [Spirochaetales bacterium]
MLEQIDSVNEAILRFLAEVPDELLAAPAYPEGWTVARNVKHALGFQKFTAFYLGLPSWLIRLLGRPRQPQKPIEKISATNREVAEYGLYPSGHPLPVGLRTTLEREIQKTRSRLKEAVEKLSEEDLDSRKGVFGGMSLRTQVLFALKHAVHHIGVARARIEAR